ncbi:hypothetical protein OAV88_02425 [bacterium]|nr:hypothetical protein [bacterium]
MGALLRETLKLNRRPQTDHTQPHTHTYHAQHIHHVYTIDDKYARDTYVHTYVSVCV